MFCTITVDIVCNMGGQSFLQKCDTTMSPMFLSKKVDELKESEDTAQFVSYGNCNHSGRALSRCYVPKERTSNFSELLLLTRHFFR
jgi:hypothetical protein